MTFIVSVCQRFTMRSGRDSNPGYAFGVYTLSRRASSTTRAPLLGVSRMSVLDGVRGLWLFCECKVKRFF